MSTNLHSNPVIMAFIREHCEIVSMNQMCNYLMVPYSSVKIIAKAFDLTFNHYSRKKLPPMSNDLEVALKEAAAGRALMKLKKRGTGRGSYQKKMRPAPEPEKKMVRPPAQYSNQSPMGIASDARHL